MPNGDMVQVHMLTAYPATLLNRDDAGLAKRISFGGAVRTRVSSQCLKKHWRDAEAVRDLGDMAVRSTRIFGREVTHRLRDEHGAAEAEATAIAGYLMDLALSKSAERKQAAEDDDVALATGQVVVFTPAEIDFLVEQGAGCLRRLRDEGIDAKSVKDVKKHAKIDDKEMKKAVQALPAALDTAMFGRMVTSDLFARVDAAVSVAHAFTTHGEEAETDYFTAVDTLKTDQDDAGAGLIQETELTSGVFYLYAVIDMNQLRANLGGRVPHEALARRLVETMATVSPGAKRGSTAPYAYTEFALLERGPQQPRTLANAFMRPVSLNGASAMRTSIDALLKYRNDLHAMHGDPEGETHISTMHPIDGVDVTPLSAALDGIFPETV